jgi:hypothetical protein
MQQIDFSHKINNPNKLHVCNDNRYVIPFGNRCPSAIAISLAGLRDFSLPFDWVTPLFGNNIKNILQNDFEDFIPDVHKGIFFNKYKIKLAHFNTNVEKGIEEYTRRIERFKKIIRENKKIYFVYINEDYIINALYRKKEFNDEKFTEMLNLEIYLKEKYEDIDFVILYFNFFEHEIPHGSNIINIVMCTTSITNDEKINTHPFRKFCGKILSDMFGTTPKHMPLNFNN